MKQYKLYNVQKGYAEVWIKLSGKINESTHLDGDGVVKLKHFVERTDFEKDEMHYVMRWIAVINDPSGQPLNPWKFGSSFTQVGKLTGYATRKEAIDALVDHVKEIKNGNDSD